MDGHEWWYLSRATGSGAFALLSASVMWGLLLSTRLFGRSVAGSWLLDVHRYLGGLTVMFTLAHVGALVGDSTVQFGPREILVPMASTWRAGAVTWGVVAFYALMVVQATSLMMHRIPRRLWRIVHTSSFVMFISVAVHGALAGSDASSPLYGWFASAMLWIVMFLTVVRLLASRRGARTEARPAGPADPARAPRPTAGAAA